MNSSSSPNNDLAHSLEGTIVNNPPLDKSKVLISLNAGAQIHPKLSGTNYPAWRVQFNALLIGYDLDGFVDGTHPCPPQYLDTACTKINPEFRLWTRQDQLIVLAIVSSVADTVVTMLGGVKTSKDAWTILKNMYANQSRSRVLSLKEKLSRLSKGDLSISNYLQQIKSLSDELAIIHQPLDNTDLVLYTLNGLTSEFREVAAAIRARDSPITFEELLVLQIDKTRTMLKRPNCLKNYHNDPLVLKFNKINGS